MATILQWSGDGLSMESFTTLQFAHSLVNIFRIQAAP